MNGINVGNEVNVLDKMTVENLIVKRNNGYFDTTLFLSKKRDNGKDVLVQINMKTKIELEQKISDNEKFINIILRALDYKDDQSSSMIKAKVTYYPEETNDFIEIVNSIK